MLRLSDARLDAGITSACGVGARASSSAARRSLAASTVLNSCKMGGPESAPAFLWQEGEAWDALRCVAWEPHTLSGVGNGAYLLDELGLREPVRAAGPDGVRGRAERVLRRRGDGCERGRWGGCGVGLRHRGRGLLSLLVRGRECGCGVLLLLVVCCERGLFVEDGERRRRRRVELFGEEGRCVGGCEC
jgi:hypothetical protein